METKYWFILRQSVFIWKKGCNCYFYDSASFVGRHFILEGEVVMQFIESLMDIDNLYSLLLKQEELEEIGIKTIVNELVILRFAKLMSACGMSEKPVQLPPVLNLQSEVRRLGEDKQTDMTIGENVLDNLLTLTLILGNESTALFVDKLDHLLKSLEHASLLELVIYGYSPVMNLPVSFWRQLEELSCLKRFVFKWNTESPNIIEQLKPFPLSNVIWDFEITSGLEYPISHTQEILKVIGISLRYSFQIFSQEDFIWAERLIEKYQIKEYRIVPRYNGRNLDFFRSCIYIDEQDILESHQTKQNIFAHQVLNTNDFGKLTVTTNGKVYANIHQSPIGSINEDIRLLVYREMTEGSSWLRVRDMAPCSNCVFQWLCPSPSDYELEIGKPNLCYVFENG